MTSSTPDHAFTENAPPTSHTLAAGEEELSQKTKMALIVVGVVVGVALLAMTVFVSCRHAKVKGKGHDMTTGFEMQDTVEMHGRKVVSSSAGAPTYTFSYTNNKYNN